MKSTNMLRLCVLLAIATFAVATADSASAKLFGKFRGGDCCCEPTPCCESGGFLSGLLDRGGDCCCEEPACPCEAEPACPCEVEPACPCEAAPVVEDCGCAEAAPVVEDCGCAEAAPCCEEPACCESGLGIFDRLGGLRGRFAGGDCGCGC